MAAVTQVRILVSAVSHTVVAEMSLLFLLVFNIYTGYFKKALPPVYDEVQNMP